MAADLHIHVFEKITLDHIKCMESHTLGSKWFDLNYDCPRCHDDIFSPNYCASEIEEYSPNVWIGEVSWLKASLLEDEDRFIPGTVGQISELIGEEFPIITDELISKIEQAFDTPNTTGYSLAKKDVVLNFLKEHKGKKVFTVSW